MEILKLKIVTKIKTKSMDVLNIKMERTEERISQLEDRTKKYYPI